eukprot:gene3041-2023_t
MIRFGLIKVTLVSFGCLDLRLVTRLWGRADCLLELCYRVAGFAVSDGLHFFSFRRRWVSFRCPCYFMDPWGCMIGDFCVCVVISFVAYLFGLDGFYTSFGCMFAFVFAQCLVKHVCYAEFAGATGIDNMFDWLCTFVVGYVVYLRWGVLYSFCVLVLIIVHLIRVRAGYCDLMIAIRLSLDYVRDKLQVVGDIIVFVIRERLIPGLDFAAFRQLLLGSRYDAQGIHFGVYLGLHLNTSYFVFVYIAWELASLFMVHGLVAGGFITSGGCGECCINFYAEFVISLWDDGCCCELTALWCFIACFVCLTIGVASVTVLMWLVAGLSDSVISRVFIVYIFDLSFMLFDITRVWIYLLLIDVLSVEVLVMVLRIRNLLLAETTCLVIWVLTILFGSGCGCYLFVTCKWQHFIACFGMMFAGESFEFVRLRCYNCFREGLRAAVVVLIYTGCFYFALNAIEYMVVSYLYNFVGMVLMFNDVDLLLMAPIWDSALCISCWVCIFDAAVACFGIPLATRFDIARALCAGVIFVLRPYDDAFFTPWYAVEAVMDWCVFYVAYKLALVVMMKLSTVLIQLWIDVLLLNDNLGHVEFSVGGMLLLL